MRTTTTLALLPMLLLGSAAAQAHAMLDSANPRVGSTVASAPRALSLSFTQNLEPAFSTVQVQDDGGARVDQGKAQVDPANPAMLRVGLKALRPGTYHVHWRVLSVDTHTTEGSFSFQVGQ
jgi:copper resistance protein C